MGRAIGVILAGGTGTRIGGDVPKQLLTLADKPLMEHCLAAFQAADGIQEIIIVMQPDYLAQAEAIASHYPKVTHVLPGGPSRTASTLAALQHLGKAAPPDTKVLIHDAARPLVTPQIIEVVLSALDVHDAASAAVPSSDTVFEVGDDGLVAAIPPRERLRRVQTPQGFRLGTISRAYGQALADPGFEAATDDCSVVFRYLPGVPIAVVDGSDTNIKVTSGQDLGYAEHLLRRPAR